MSLSSYPSLPIELLLSIFSFLKESHKDGEPYYDKESFRSFSLVSHVWRDLALPYLFPRVSVKLPCGDYTLHDGISKDGYDGLADSLQRKSFLRYQTPRSVAQFLGAHPIICHSIRTLELISQGALVMDAPALLSILHLLPSLSRLALIGITLAVPPGFQPAVGQSQKLSLSKLRIRLGFAKCTNDFLNLFGLFDSIHELRVEGSDDLLPQMYSGPVPRVHAVRISQFTDHGIEIFLKLLRSSPALASHIKRLHVEEIVTRAGVESLAQILLTLGAGLERLDVDLETLARMSPGWRGLDLSPCLNLRALSLSLTFDFAHYGLLRNLKPYNVDVWLGLARLFTTIPIGVEAITVSMSVAYAVDWDPEDVATGFSGIEDVLLILIHGGLKTVQFRLKHCQGQEPRMWSDIMSRLPRVEREGVLKLVDW